MLVEDPIEACQCIVSEYLEEAAHFHCSAWAVDTCLNRSGTQGLTCMFLLWGMSSGMTRTVDVGVGVGLVGKEFLVLLLIPY